MIDDTSFETHPQQILQLGRIIVEQHAKIERLKALLKRAADVLENKQWNVVSREDLDLVAELRKAAE